MMKIIHNEREQYYNVTPEKNQDVCGKLIDKAYSVKVNLTSVPHQNFEHKRLEHT